jgi:hypothetical protein
MLMNACPSGGAFDGVVSAMRTGWCLSPAEGLSPMGVSIETVQNLLSNSDIKQEPSFVMYYGACVHSFSKIAIDIFASRLQITR